jgi:NYN domain/OST-HTH/LOTUS domain
MTESARVAVLIDCDNISYRWAGAILGETAKHGTLSIKRAYGDWANERLKNWRPALSAHAVQPVQQFAYTTGKNSTDFALVIDAMDLLYSGNVDSFCIVSSDGDFTRLAMRLRESGKLVYGIGARKTPEPFQNACDRFIYVEVLVDQADLDAEAPEPVVVTAASRAPAKKAAKRTTKQAAPKAAVTTQKTSATAQRQKLEELADLLVPAIEASTTDETGWANLSAVGQYLANTRPSFDTRSYDYPNLSSMVRDVPEIELNEVSSGNGLTTLHVRAAGRRTRKRR